MTKTEKKLKDDLQRLGSSNSSLNGKNLTLHNKVTKLEEQIQILKDKLTDEDKQACLKEAKESTDWIYSTLSIAFKDEKSK